MDKNSTFDLKIDQMRILLIGEYSNLHWTLACGLRSLGHEVVVVSSGDQFKSYQRDITLKRGGHSLPSTLKYITQIFYYFRKFRGFDVVQVINPIFLELRCERVLEAFRILKKRNGKVFLGAFGDDYFWVKSCLQKDTFRYSEFDIPGKLDLMETSEKLAKDWVGTAKESLNQQIAEESDGIIACLYEYFAAYKPHFGEKACYIPAPINTKEITFQQRGKHLPSVDFFIGIQKKRSEWKGTDVMLQGLLRIKEAYPDECTIQRVESVPYSEYVEILKKSDVILDQLYSYSPAMNALTAMAKGLVVVGGGEPEIYDILGEKELRPILNVFPSEEGVYQVLEKIIQEKEKLPQLSKESRLFVERHHDFRKVAQQYIDFWTK